jgi:hypothetical protein
MGTTSSSVGHVWMIHKQRKAENQGLKKRGAPKKKKSSDDVVLVNAGLEQDR